jgi:predicted nucleotidyltransferase
MDKTDAINIVQKYAGTIKNMFDFQRIFLFGSYAKGNQHEDSDIDIAVVFKDFDNCINTQTELMKLTRKIDTRIEPHPFRENEFNISNPLVNEILKYGMEVKYNHKYFNFNI